MPFSRSAGADGVTLKWRDFEHVPEMTTCYRLTASITDLAGNVTETELLFSVNPLSALSMCWMRPRSSWLEGMVPIIQARSRIS